MSSPNPQPDDSVAAPEPVVNAPHSAPQKLRLSKPHRLIQRMLEKEPAKPETYGYYRQAPSRPEVDLRVSKGEKRSALIVMDRLFKALEAADLKVDVTEGQNYGYGTADNYSAGTYATSADARDRTRLWIEEEHRKVPHVPTAKELRDKEQDKYGPAIPKYDSAPTGKLTLNPGGVADLSSEAAVGLLVQKAVQEVAAKLEELRLEREAREEAQRREHRKEQEKQAEKSRVEALHKAAGELHRYRQMMDYIAEVRRFGRVPPDQRREGQTLEQWLEWAEWRARRVHPLG